MPFQPGSSERSFFEATNFAPDSFEERLRDAPPPPLAGILLLKSCGALPKFRSVSIS